MVKGGATETKVHYKGKDEDFIVFVDDVQALRDWKSDKSIPLAHVVQAFKIFVTHKHGAQGTFDGASKATLENEFGTSNEDDAIKAILEKGTMQESEMAERSSTKNESQGPRVAH